MQMNGNIRMNIFESIGCAIDDQSRKAIACLYNYKYIFTDKDKYVAVK